MIRFLLLSLLFFSVTANSQSLRKDTIDCCRYKISLSVPSMAGDLSRITNYEEGFYKSYPLGDGSFIIVHYGSLVEDVIEADSLIYECKMGNIASSVLYMKNEKYFRIDKYYQFGVSLSFQFVKKENLALAESILNNVEIMK